MELSPSEISKLFDHWSELQVLKIVTPEVKSKILEQNFRESIITIFQNGIQDTDPRSGKKVRRHILSAKEIMYYMERELKMSVKYPGLYFHLSKLEEFQIITEVTRLKIKKNNVSYYGLTAKNFTSSPFEIDKPHENNIYTFHLIQTIASELALNSEEGISLLKDAVNELQDLKMTKPAGFTKWINQFSFTSNLSEETIDLLLNIYRYKASKTQGITDLFLYLTSKFDNL